MSNSFGESVEGRRDESTVVPTAGAAVAPLLAQGFRDIVARLRAVSNGGSSGTILAGVTPELCDASVALLDALEAGLLDAPKAWPGFAVELRAEAESHVRHRRSTPAHVRPSDEFLQFVDPRPLYLNRYCASVMPDVLDGPPDGFSCLHITQRHGEADARLQAQLYARGMAAACDRLADQVGARAMGSTSTKSSSQADASRETGTNTAQAGDRDGVATTGGGRHEPRGGTPNGPVRTEVVLWAGAEPSNRNIRLARTRTAYLEAHGNVRQAMNTLKRDGYGVSRSTFYNHLDVLDKLTPRWRESVQLSNPTGNLDGMRKVGIRGKARGEVR